MSGVRWPSSNGTQYLVLQAGAVAVGSGFQAGATALFETLSAMGQEAEFPPTPMPTTPPPTTPPPTTPQVVTAGTSSSDNGKMTAEEGAGIAVGVMLLLIIVVGVILWSVRSRDAKPSKQTTHNPTYAEHTYSGHNGMYSTFATRYALSDKSFSQSLTVRDASINQVIKCST